LAPDALPSSAGFTALRITFAIGAKNMPMPMPDTMNGPTSDV
jgi:hypothetical protein